MSLMIKASRPLNQLNLRTFNNRRLIIQSLATQPSSMESPSSCKTLNMRNLNPHIIEMQYAVRGPLVIRAAEIEKELKQGVSKPFPSVIRANIGDAHAMQQHPITFIRQVIAACTYPSLVSSMNLPDDIKARAEMLLDACGGCSVGAYSSSVGIEAIRKHVSEYIENRDGGIQCDPENVVLTSGASEAIRTLLKLFNHCQPDGTPPGVMIPIPQYPLYSATLSEYGIHQIGYYLDEERQWGLEIGELRRALNSARSVCNPLLLCVINPGNPTGQVLSRSNIEEVIKFAHDEKLFIFADEVYQDNVYDPASKFHSFKKVMTEMGEPYCKMELASFHSASKGYMGECGLRGGYAEIVNMEPDVFAHYKKSISAKLCSSVLGQVAIDCVVKPPKPGEPSYALYAKEKAEVLKNLSDKALMISDSLNKIDGVKCNRVQGAMYAFPRIFLPLRAVEAAKEANMAPDDFYATNLLESTGICIVPGSGFGQKEGTYHFRTTILPPPHIFKEFIDRFTVFHNNFMATYA